MVLGFSHLLVCLSGYGVHLCVEDQRLVSQCLSCYLFVCFYAQSRASVHGCQKSALNHLDQVVVSHPVWGLGTKFLSSGMAAYFLNPEQSFILLLHCFLRQGLSPRLVRLARLAG